MTQPETNSQQQQQALEIVTDQNKADKQQKTPQQLQNEKRILRYRIFTFVVTFCSYAAAHCIRTSWSQIKPQIKSDKQYGLDTKFLGYMDMTFLLSYGIGLATLGRLGDRLNLRFFTGFGMFGTSIVLMTLGAIQINHALTGDAQKAVFIILWILNGLCESTGMPGFVSAMGNWFSKNSRGAIMGFWIGTTNTGDIMGYILGGVMTYSMNLYWGYVPIVSGFMLGVMGIILLLFLRPYPEKLGLFIDEEGIANADQELIQRRRLNSSFMIEAENKTVEALDDYEQKIKKDVEEQRNAKPVTFLNAWLIPNVALYALIFSVVKSTIYSLLFWLPTYLSDKNLKGLNVYITCVFDAGIFLGGFIVGKLSDRIGKRSVVMVPSLFVATMMILTVILLDSSAFGANFVLFFIIGAFLGGPYNVIQSAIMIDLAKQKGLAKNTRALATVTGLIDGCGAIISAIMQVIIPFIGTTHIFYLLFGLACSSFLFLIPLLVKDTKSLLRRRQRKIDFMSSQIQLNGKKQILNDPSVPTLQNLNEKKESTDPLSTENKA
ncbi:MFS transporter (macronuclear) [Tetrahymena thermophila SB210]|uniref:MFS transporter n=1 Tax=Tetrahymena thermophila (strain SB210) TaxID=312017 RepID=Q229Q2_TETTS|nr:MFS transporter [Tetrahymena thermophila SB210]EAR82020.1 MFS transporter [Tetrahymena thermophila SB210]|eukprot:XP_001029683.1 MFS transporter [Tetrahymena thermophila SB210]